ncbi:MAG: N-acetylmuramoyl-L-alanine amidase [Myxococcales bacterium]|nr:N-acetylmuramoyl-L-alanine amidase [Myxococcales bacterium]
MSIVLGGIAHEVEGLRSVSYLDDPKIAPRITDSDARKRRVRSVIVHTTSGTCRAGKVKPGRLATDDRAGVLARYQTRTARRVSWDYTVGRDGVVIAQNDPVERYSWHATAWNPISVGIELVQDADGTLYEEQLGALVLLVDELTRRLRIQRQLAWVGDAPVLSQLARADEKGAKGVDMVGVFAHVHNTLSRGAGDPGPAPFRALRAAGYEGFDFAAGADRSTWRERQRALGIAADGIALDDTCAALERSGRACGLWVPRPGDAP